jgi:hypothetical protein
MGLWIPEGGGQRVSKVDIEGGGQQGPEGVEGGKGRGQAEEAVGQEGPLEAQVVGHVQTQTEKTLHLYKGRGGGERGGRERGGIWEAHRGHVRPTTLKERDTLTHTSLSIYPS